MTKSFSPPISTNYQHFLRMNTRRFRGEWIALVGAKVVAHGKRADTTYRSAFRRYPQKDISLAKIPQEETLVL